MQGGIEMELKGTLGKVADGLKNISREVQICVSIAEEFSDEELLECTKNNTRLILLFSNTEAKNINLAIKKMTCEKMATDRDLL